HLKFDILLSFKNALSLYGPEVTEAWGHTGFFTYLKLKIGSDPQNFQKKMDDLVDAQCAGMMETYKLRVLLPLQPLKDIHLTSHYMQEYEANGSRESVNILLIVAFIIIVMAWVNYTNLSTARSLIRAKEVGLRKVVGASRSQLVFQFFFETVLLNGIALVLALILFQIALPVFLKITGLPFPSHIWGQAWFWSLILGLFFIGVIFSGFYPVTVLTAFNPAKVLKGNLGRAAKGLNLRRILVIFQFIFALTLITATLSIYRQVATMKNRDLGFDRERILVVQSPRVRGELFKDNFETFKNEILKDTLVQKICAVTEVPGRQIYWDAGGIRKAGESAALGKNYQIVGVDFDFVDVFNLKILLGRNFSREFPSDAKALLLNETAVHWMGFKNAEEAVGHQVDYWGEFFTIIGVLADYHQQSPKNSMEPHLYRFMPYGRGPRGKFAMKIAPEETNRTINRIEDRYMSMFPGNPFEYFFLDDYFNQQYRADELFGKVIGLFAFLAIFVTGMGIFGMSSYMAVQRTREIGNRKTLGATTGLIFRMMFKDFLVLIGISVVVA
ncbi:MAG: ABC transporter permease, partial [Candidatus Aminicenantes bacterium]|nr:ABC transporter permease [Candidatus Aminicenantes bacterium]